ncbi:MAG: adenylate/guanylate cyclase domain-containing protein [Thermodesulfobacteriota bacterium]
MIINYSIPPHPTERFESGSDTIIIGRSKKSGQPIDLDLIQDEYASHRHARLTCENNQYWIEDLGSRNGTLVNGKTISKKTRLTPRSKLQIGETIITILMPAAPVAAAPAEEEELEGTIINTDDVMTSFTRTERGEAFEVPAQEWRKLKAFNDLCQSIGKAGNLDTLGKILVNQLKQAMPCAQRGAILMPDPRGKMLLKAHWPAGDHSVSTTLATRACTNREAFIWTAPSEAKTGPASPHSAVYFKVQSAIYAPLTTGEQVLGVIYVDNYLSREAFLPADLELLRAIAGQISLFLRDHVLREDLRRKEEAQMSLMRQFSPEVAKRVMDKYGGLRGGGEKVDPVTILVTDVRNFTALSARMDPDDVVRMLNEMFDAFVPIIFEYNGVIDKYVGDSVLAVFGSPDPDERQWEKAVRAAMEMQLSMEKLGEGRKVRRLPIFQVGISIHSGAVIHGFVGSAKRMEYTVIGDAVNLSARLCDGAEPGEIIISKSVYERIYQIVEVEPKMIRTKHPDLEPDLEAYVIKKLR